MNICFCIAQMNSGGAERVVANLSNAFAKKNNKITILLISVTNAISFYNLDSNIQLDVLSNTKSYKGFKKIKLMKEYFKNKQFDIVISFLPNPIIYTYFSLRGLKTKLICSERSNPKKYDFMRRVLLRHIFKTCSGAVFQTFKAKEYYNRDDAIVIYNPITNVQQYSNIKHNKCIAFIGSFRKVKNFILLFKSFKEFSSRNPDYCLNIYGVESNNKKCLYKIDKYNLTGKVNLKGKINDIQKELIKSSLYVSTSLYEGMSNSVLEAASLGIPCVVTDCDIGGNYEISKYYQNVHLSGFDYKTFSRSMSEAINKFTKPTIKQVFSLDYISNKWLNYIISISEK